MAAKEVLDDVMSKLGDILLPSGIEYHPFKIGWYNDEVAQQFELDYSRDTVAFILITTPSFFEKAFLPFVKCGLREGARDPIDDCLMHYSNLVKQALGDRPVKIMHDFELTHSRRPLVLVQTAGHVSGAARYYQRCDVINDPWEPNKKIFGVSVHPKYGGWFALRGVLVLSDVLFKDLPRRTPLDVLPDDAGRIELLNRFNGNWKDWSFRDIIPVKDHYSELQRLYFATSPRKRKELTERLKAATPDTSEQEEPVSHRQRVLMATKRSRPEAPISDDEDSSPVLTVPASPEHPVSEEVSGQALRRWIPTSR